MNSVTLPIESIENNSEKVILNFIDNEKGELYEVIWNKQKYDKSQNKYVSDKGKEMEVAKWCEKYLGVPIEQIFDAEGQEHTVYINDKFNSLWKSANAWTEDMVGQIFNTTITDIQANDREIEIFYDIDGETYSTHWRYTKWKNDRQLINPQKRRKQQQKFLDNFGVPVEEADKAIGQEILVEGKKAFNTVFYGEVKKQNKRK